MSNERLVIMMKRLLWCGLIATGLGLLINQGWLSILGLCSLILCYIIYLVLCNRISPLEDYGGDKAPLNRDSVIDRRSNGKDLVSRGTKKEVEGFDLSELLDD